MCLEIQKKSMWERCESDVDSPWASGGVDDASKIILY